MRDPVRVRASNRQQRRVKPRPISHPSRLAGRRVRPDDTPSNVRESWPLLFLGGAGVLLAAVLLHEASQFHPTRLPLWLLSLSIGIVGLISGVTALVAGDFTDSDFADEAVRSGQYVLVPKEEWRAIQHRLMPPTAGSLPLTSGSYQGTTAAYASTLSSGMRQSELPPDVTWVEATVGGIPAPKRVRTATPATEDPKLRRPEPPESHVRPMAEVAGELLKRLPRAPSPRAEPEGKRMDRPTKTTTGLKAPSPLPTLSPVPSPVISQVTRGKERRSVHPPEPPRAPVPLDKADDEKLHLEGFRELLASLEHDAVKQVKGREPRLSEDALDLLSCVGCRRTVELQGEWDSCADCGLPLCATCMEKPSAWISDGVLCNSCLSRRTEGPKPPEPPARPLAEEAEELRKRIKRVSPRKLQPEGKGQVITGRPSLPAKTQSPPKASSPVPRVQERRSVRPQAPARRPVPEWKEEDDDALPAEAFRELLGTLELDAIKDVMGGEPGLFEDALDLLTCVGCHRTVGLAGNWDSCADCGLPLCESCLKKPNARVSDGILCGSCLSRRGKKSR